ncbi:TetR/AcrR family transcriptional regulator [Streptomyces mexicanus]|uniref:TetR/AcrR family transcriptional regulator n=1 Tax=Streptomyces mexicanus TaxID=178566 RepID=UPI001356D854|nr:TetR/AcrR family transcriptional regulator [Streptomyces mexicanus]
MSTSRETAAGQRRTAGRPRDPGVESRVLAAALDVYADHGWSGFTFDAIARRSAAGKAALYRRWQNKEELLLAALEAHAMVVEPIDTGTVHDDLLVVARELFAVYLQGSVGLASLRLFVEARAHPDLLAKSWSRVNAARVRAARTMIRRAVERGELPPDTSATVLLEALSGGGMAHVLATPAGPDRGMDEGDERFLAALVDLVLRGARCRCPRSGCGS